MAEPLTLDQAKQNLRVDTSDDDDFITDLIVAAREHVENYTGLVLTQRQITETAPELGRSLTLCSWPVSDVTAIRYPLSGVMTPLVAGSWLTSFTARPARILPVAYGWGVGVLPFSIGRRPTLPVEIDVAAGFASPNDVPAVVKRAMHLLIGTWYVNREADVVGRSAAAVELPTGVQLLLRRWRKRSL
jgi:uncharacterized phiE125 gp8 family phage protein